MADVNWETVPDEDIVETVFERLLGLTEMFPLFMQDGARFTIDWTKWLTTTGFWLARNTTWIVASSSTILFLPYIVEKERSDLEKSQVAMQRQLLLGPSSVVANVKPRL